MSQDYLYVGVWPCGLSRLHILHLSLHAHLPHSGADTTETVTQGTEAAKAPVEGGSRGHRRREGPRSGAHRLHLFQPLLGHGPWADAKEPSRGGGPWAEGPCLGQESFTFSECLRLRDVRPGLWEATPSRVHRRPSASATLILTQTPALPRSFSMKIRRRFKEPNKLISPHCPLPVPVQSSITNPTGSWLH